MVAEDLNKNPKVILVTPPGGTVDSVCTNYYIRIDIDKLIPLPDGKTVLWETFGDMEQYKGEYFTL